jgi:hypothetical protein
MPTRLVVLLGVVFVCLGAAAVAQEEIPIQTWPAPPYWAPPAQPQRATEDAEAVVAEIGELDPEALPTEPLPFIGITPCRLIDTRNPAGTYGGPPLAAGVPRSFPVAGQCGVAANAGAVSINATVVNTQGPGFVAFYPEGGSFPGVSNVNYTAAWQTVANAAVVPLGPGGFTALAGVSGTDLIVDVNGYYAPEGVRSVFGRTGAVAATAGDYTASQVTNVPAGGIAATTVQAAVNELDGEKAAASHAHWGASWSGAGTGLALSGGSTGLDASGTSYGVYASNATAGGSAGAFVETATSGGGNGVYGSSASPNGFGGHFSSAATTGQAIAVYGYTNSTAGISGYFVSDNNTSTATKAGVYGRDDSDTGGPGYGVAGHGYYTGVGVGAWSYSGDLFRGYAGDFPGGTLRFYVTQAGNLYIDGTYNAFRPVAGPDGTVEVRTLYSPQSPEQWSEDLGTAELVAGAATVTIEPMFAETVDLVADYRVFLTPLGDCPLYVAAKGATSFTVRAIGGQPCSVAFDYRLVARPKGTAGTRLSVVDKDFGAPSPRK